MKKYYEEIMLDAKIIKINRICDLICFTFLLPTGEKIHLHVTCYIRIYDCNGLLSVCSSNLSNRSQTFHKKWYKKYDWSQVGATVFDDALKESIKDLFSAKVLKFMFVNDDIKIILDNHMHIDVLNNVTKYDDENYYENYRLFSDDDEKEHFVM